jgi:hypothetical protein
MLLGSLRALDPIACLFERTSVRERSLSSRFITRLRGEGYSVTHPSIIQIEDRSDIQYGYSISACDLRASSESMQSIAVESAHTRMGPSSTA